MTQEPKTPKELATELKISSCYCNCLQTPGTMKIPPRCTVDIEFTTEAIRLYGIQERNRALEEAAVECERNDRYNQNNLTFAANIRKLMDQEKK